MEQTLRESLDKSISSLLFYIVINSSGQFFRAKGYGGYGETWTNDIKKAKIYGKIGPARARVTWFASTYPNYPPPAIIKLSVGQFELLEEKGRVTKEIKTKEEKEAGRKKKNALRQFEYARDTFIRAQEEYERALKQRNNI